MATLQSPVVTLSYPHLFVPRPKAEGSPDLVYSAVGLLNPAQMKSPAWAALQAAVEAESLRAFPKLLLGKGVKSPFNSTEDRENFPKEYKTFFNCWSKVRPGIVDTGRNHILDANEVWAGQYVRFSLNPFAWEHTGKKGVSLGLNHVQIIKSEGLKRLDGRKPVEEAFDDEYDDVDEEV